MFVRSLAFAALAGAASARIVGLAAPKVIVANEPFPVTLITENYIQSVKDLVAAFALNPRSDLGFIGTEFLGSYYLGPEQSDILTNITFDVTAPANTVGTYLSAIVTSLYGASNGATTIQWTVPITYGDAVSSDLVTDFNFTNVCSTTTTTPPPSNTTTPSPPNSSPTQRDPSATCFPSLTQPLIQSTQIYIQALITAIVQNNPPAGRQARGELNGFLGDVSAATGGGRAGENCDLPPTPAWPPLSESDSRVRAIQILTDAQTGLQALAGAVLECDAVRAKGVVCGVLGLVGNLDGYPPFA